MRMVAVMDGRSWSLNAPYSAAFATAVQALALHCIRLKTFKLLPNQLGWAAIDQCCEARCSTGARARTRLASMKVRFQ